MPALASLYAEQAYTESKALSTQHAINTQQSLYLVSPILLVYLLQY